MKLEGKKAAILIADGFLDQEVEEASALLQEQGMGITYLSSSPGAVTGMDGHVIEDGVVLADIEPGVLSLLLIPGGRSPELLRLDKTVLEFTRACFEEGVAVACMGHGAQVLISARVLPGRTMTTIAGIRDDVQLAGARFMDKPAAVDGRLLSARTSKDMAALGEAIVGLLAEATEEIPTG